MDASNGPTATLEASWMRHRSDTVCASPRPRGPTAGTMPHQRLGLADRRGRHPPSALEHPLDGLLFDLDHNDLWWPEWRSASVRHGAGRGIDRRRLGRASSNPALLPPIHSGAAAGSWQSGILRNAGRRHLLWSQLGGLLPERVLPSTIPQSAGSKRHQVHPILVRTL